MRAKLKGFNHWGWPIATFVAVLTVTSVIGALILNSFAINPDFNNIPNNVITTSCPPFCGASPWILQHPLFLLGFMGVVALVGVIIIIIEFLMPDKNKIGRKRNDDPYDQ